MNLLFVQGEGAVEASAPVQQTEVIEVSTAATEAPIEEAPAASGGMSFWLMLIAMIAIMYFFMWRPESKRRKQMENFRKGLKKGDKVITAGGIYGVVKEIQETSLLIEVDSNVTLRVDKNMIVADPANNIPASK